MAFEITLPRLGWDMEEGSLAAWLKQDGEFVTAGEMLLSVEGDKAIQEIEALDSGYLHILPGGPQPGQKLPVGTLLGYLVPEAERSSFRLPGGAQVSESAAVARPVELLQPVQVEARSPQPAPVLAGQGRLRRVYISPYAKRLAEGQGVDWRSLSGSGRDGRIMAKDVEAAARQRTVAAPRPSPLPAAETRTPLTPLRRRIAEHMSASAHTAAPVTLTSEADASQLVALRKALKDDAQSAGQIVPSYNDILAGLSARALVEHPWVNARLEDDAIVQSVAVHVAIAVDTERGLLVPVLRDVQRKSLRQIARESADLVEKARKGTLAYEELQGATFTITNLGMYEIDAFTPIIDLPQCAILGVGRIVPKPVVLDIETARMEIHHMMFLSLTFDHRLIDGAGAARFLQRVKHLIEQPYLWLAD